MKYHVTAYCRAQVKETWVITSATPLDQEDIEDILVRADLPDGVEIECTDEEVSDEEDREITDIEEES